LTDNPVSLLSGDLFGFRPYIEELHEVVRHADPLPLTVGVFGPWGSGKSSFLRMWQDLLKRAPQDRTVWFNPWKYDQRVEVWAALLQSLLAEVAIEETSGDKAGRLAKAATWLALKGGAGFAMNYASGGVINADKIDSVVDAVASANAKHYADINRFEADFAESLNTLLPPEGRLFVFVDDLDRCTPDAAVSVLEALKLFIGDARCVFVLAMDFDLLTSVAAAKFGSGIAVDGNAYLEKIVQLPFHLPDIRFGALQEEYAGHLGPLGSDDVFWDLLRIGFGPNPRRVKRFINVYNLARAILRRDTSVSATLSRQQELQLAVLLIIRSENRAFFRFLRDNTGAWESVVQQNSGRLPAEVQPYFEDTTLSGLLRRQDVSPPSPAWLARMLGTVRLTAPLDSI
jgi:hypothetical protein